MKIEEHISCRFKNHLLTLESLRFPEIFVRWNDSKGRKGLKFVGGQFIYPATAIEEYWHSVLTGPRRDCHSSI